MCLDITVEIFKLYYSKRSKKRNRLACSERHLLIKLFPVSSVLLRTCTTWYSLEFTKDCCIIVISYLYVKMKW